MYARARWLFGVGALASALAASCGDAPAEKTTAGPRRVVGSGGGGQGGAGGGATTSGPLCGATCEHESAGAGSSDPFALAGHDASGVGVDDSGALVLTKVEAPKGKDLIWIASSGGDYVSKFDTVTYAELGRYYVGPDPSRTSVDARGDVYVGLRAGGGVVKVSSAGASCPDTNKDGKVTTSTGQGMLAKTQDDCVLWRTTLNHEIRGVAAQERKVAAGEDPKSDVWVGTLDGLLWKLDGTTGEVLLETPAPCDVYGLALDGAGQLWMTHLDCLGRIDTARCLDGTSCAALEKCTTACKGWAGCDDACDAAGRQVIAFPDQSYGITVDFRGRVWLAGGEGIKRYDPSAPKGKRWANAPTGFAHGVAADAMGYVWAAADPQVMRIDGDTLDHFLVETPSSKGIAVDRQGKIWVISNLQDFATVIVPGEELAKNEVVKNAVTGLKEPYTYSDMTGVQAALATGGSGRYVQRFTGCPDGETAWIELAWDATVPKGTSLAFRVRTADNAAAIDTATWMAVANVPSATSPASVAGALSAAGVPAGKLLDVELTMSITASASSPKVKAMTVGYACPKDQQPK